MWSGAIPLKRVKIEKKVAMEALCYQRSFGRYHSRRPTPPKFFCYPIISGPGTGKTTDFIFCWYIHRVHPNKSPFKILQKRQRGRMQGLLNFFGTQFISGTGKATNFKFCTHIHRIDRNKNPFKISGKVAVGVLLFRHVNGVNIFVRRVCAKLTGQPDQCSINLASILVCAQRQCRNDPIKILGKGTSPGSCDPNLGGGELNA